MAESTGVKEQPAAPAKRESAYDAWMRSTGVPVHKGYYVEDLRTLELGALGRA